MDPEHTRAGAPKFTVLFVTPGVSESTSRVTLPTRIGFAPPVNVTLVSASNRSVVLLASVRVLVPSAEQTSPTRSLAVACNSSVPLFTIVGPV